MEIKRSKEVVLNRLSKENLALVSQIGRLAQAQGMVAYLVGGPVRDLAIKLPNVDLDITVEGSGIRLAQEFSTLHPSSKLVRYPAFKTATVGLSGGHMVDFATARKETYSKGGVFPKVVLSNIKDDLFRRDFTINAIAISINPDSWGKVVDPFGGMDDLRAKRIRILHEKSFVDDPTRIVRAARFKTRLGFTLERNTLKILKRAVKAKVLDTIKPQRYRKEFNKILKEKEAKKAMDCLRSWKAYLMESRFGR